VSEPAHVPLAVVQLGFFNDPQQRSGPQLLEAWPSLVDVAEAAAHAGARVSVVQVCAHAGHVRRNGVDYYFERAPGARLTALAPDVLHVHGLAFHREVRWLKALLPHTPLLLQDHASRPPHWWRRRAWRRGFAGACAVAFCARAQAEPFVRAGLLASRTRVCEIPEASCRFTPGEQREARRVTGVHGAPAVLWVGHLDGNKDPLTVLTAVSRASRTLPGLELWCCYGVAPLMTQVAERIARDPQLRARVHLLGPVPHAHIEQLMRAADLFVLGSHREGSGYALIEALACGLPPLVTDIPSFRALTAAGTVGRLWPCGNAAALATALEQLAAGAAGQRGAVRAHFERELSFTALGAKLHALYRQLAQPSPHGQAQTAQPQRARA
jgi:glycosyltransferase involved in cell wall biosynthesis